ncbi:centromere protein M isoform X2 [Ictidomys tridecemlineatus]
MCVILPDRKIRPRICVEGKWFRSRSHLAKALPLPSNVNRPRIDLIVFVINLHSKYRPEKQGLCCLHCEVCPPLVCFLALAWPPSLQHVEESLHHVDASFFLGRVCFLGTGAGQEHHCSLHRNTVLKLAHTYRSPLFFCDLEVEDFQATMAQRLVRMLLICAGHVRGVSALNLLSLLRTSETPPPEEL